jgi:hypothetical protein
MSGEASVSDHSETMTKIRISNDPNLFFKVGRVKFGAFEILIFEFVSNFVFRYSDFHPFATQTTNEAFVSSPQDIGHDHLPRGEGGQRSSTLLPRG